MKVIDSKAIPAAIAREYMNQMNEEEMSYEQKITNDFLNKYYKDLKKEDVEKAMEELKELELKDHQIAMILNVLPEDDDEVKAIFAKERTQPSEEVRKKILEVVAKIK